MNSTRRTIFIVSADAAVTQPQNLSPEEWTQIIAVFGPLAIVFGKDVWKIVIVPKLKHLFKDDRIADSPPKKDKSKKQDKNKKKKR